MQAAKANPAQAAPGTTTGEKSKKSKPVKEKPPGKQPPTTERITRKAVKPKTVAELISTPATANPQTKHTMWVTVTDEMYLGLVDSKQDVYRVKIAAVSNSGKQYKGTVLSTGKTLNFMKTKTVADPGINVTRKASNAADAPAGPTQRKHMGNLHQGNKPKTKPVTTDTGGSGTRNPKQFCNYF